jgi:hypothetical protein
LEKSDPICQQIAAEENVSEKTVRNAAKFALLVDEVDAHVGHDCKASVLACRLW